MFRNIKNKYLFLGIALFAIVYCLIEAEGNGDFYIFMWAAGELSKGLNIYDHKYNNDYSYYYSVLFALFLKPFYTLSFFWVKFCWLLLNLSLFIHLMVLLIQSSFYKILSQQQKNWFLIGVFAFSFRFLHENIHHAQITILMLWTCIYGIYSIYTGRSISGSALLALGINIKLFPLVFIPYLIYRGFFKEVFYVFFFYVLMMFLPSLFIGHQYNLNMLQSWWLLVNPTKTNHVLDVDERSFHGLSTLLATLLIEKVPDYYAMSLRRNILDLPYHVFSMVLLFARLFIVSLVLKFLKWPPFKKQQAGFATKLEIAYILLVIPIIFPHQQHYAFLFATPAFACAWYYFVLNRNNMLQAEKTLMIILLSLSFIFCTIKMWLGEFNAYYEHFKILTYGALLLIPILFKVSNGIKQKAEQDF